jgi:hypothetical protein
MRLVIDDERTERESIRHRTASLAGTHLLARPSRRHRTPSVVVASTGPPGESPGLLGKTKG